MPNSVFMDKTCVPDERSLLDVLGQKAFARWERICGVCRESGAVAQEGWHFSGKKFGWSYRLSDKKRVLIYLLPREGFFKVAFVFGDQAVEFLRTSEIDLQLLRTLVEAKKYAEGRGIRFAVQSEEETQEALELLKVKLKF